MTSVETKEKITNEISSLIIFDLHEFEDVYQFTTFMESINDIYNFYAFIQLGQYISDYYSKLRTSKNIEIKEKMEFYFNYPTRGMNYDDLKDLANGLDHVFKLKINSIVQNSDPIISFKGIGEPLKQIKDFILGYKKSKREDAESKIKIEKEEQNLIKLRLENTKLLFDIASKYHVSPENVLNLSNQITLKQKYIGDLSQSNQIKSVVIKEIDKT